MPVAAFGYVGLRSDKLDDWAEYAPKFLGLQLVERTQSALKFRTDDRKQRITTPVAFVPGRPISGFRTGTLGMGHVVLNVESVEDLLWFYQDALGFGLSDYILRPFKAYFLPRQPTSSQPGHDRNRPQRHPPHHAGAHEPR